MNTIEMKTLKMNLLGGMNEYIKNLSDEDAWESWIQLIPDECDEEDLEFIAGDKFLWTSTCKLFGRLVQKYGDTEIISE